MSGRLSAIWRHPIKAHGREPLDRVALAAGQTLPGDRVWAVAHDAARAEAGTWSPCTNFSRGAKAPQLMALTVRSHDDGDLLTLSHPERPDLTFAPGQDDAAFLDWVAPLMPPGRVASQRLIRAGTRGMTDTDFPSISLAGTASLSALSEKLGQALSPDRFRSNLWIDGLAPWAEFDWVGRHVSIGGAIIEIRERIGRCLATAANPDTGERDADTLGALEDGWGHTQFGVYGVVTTGGKIAVGDRLGALR